VRQLFTARHPKKVTERAKNGSDRNILRCGLEKVKQPLYVVLQKIEQR
jgi:hypothetical protein